MTDRLDIALHDHELLAEIELVTELMITATASERALCLHTVDAVLDVPGRSGRPAQHCGCCEAEHDLALRTG